MKLPLQNKFSVWDKRFFDLSELVSTWSEDTSRKVGVVIVGSANQILSTGYNGLPRGVLGTEAIRYSKENGEKYFWFEHAERNAIFNAARSGVALENATLYSTLFPCAECARAIVQSGITTLKTFEAPMEDHTYKHSFEKSKIILAEAGVKTEVF
ncbi:deoxycytidylate deaminase [Cochlodiniinecator piscidefendens]|uniref:deoxycytidylate deaminase n=1 Tax=Cochlodiniinecator piscidefendens TaxID=2715756 RepID=UPI00140725B1|nr:dCMP deaminase family protein [Cochlodiniinecator piscidefendens]